VRRHLALAVLTIIAVTMLGSGVVAAPTVTTGTAVTVRVAGLATAPGPGTTAAAPGYALEGFVWPAGAQVNVYSTWDGGACFISGSDLSGPASALDPAIAAQALQASIDAINSELRGGLVLVNVGSTTRAELCSHGGLRPVVIGFGSIPEVGRTLSFGQPSPVAGAATAYQSARVFLSETYGFACGTAPVYRDLQHTITHELLHAIGIGHSQDPAAIMAPSFVACRSAYVLQPDDVASLAALYPPAIQAPSTTVRTPAFLATPVFSGNGQALAVFSGGTVADLERAAAAAHAAGVWAQDAGGAYRLLIVGGPAFTSDAFTASFPAGFASVTAVTLVRGGG